MRADARRNRRRLLDAAIALILEIGGEPSRDAVAQRAGVGIATLYRHFPDQQALLRAVVLDVLDRTIEPARSLSSSRPPAARRCAATCTPPSTPASAWSTSSTRCSTTRDWPDRRAAAHDMLDRLIEAARRDGAIDDDVTADRHRPRHHPLLPTPRDRPRPSRRARDRPPTTGQLPRRADDATLTCEPDPRHNNRSTCRLETQAIRHITAPPEVWAPLGGHRRGKCVPIEEIASQSRDYTVSPQRQVLEGIDRLRWRVVGAPSPDYPVGRPRSVKVGSRYSLAR